jgi:hypothetical protein
MVDKRKRLTEAERLIDQNKDLKTPVRASRRNTQTSLSKYVLDVRQRISDTPSVELDNIYAKIKEENSKITENITQEKVTEVYNNILTEINKLFNIFSKNKSTDFSKTISFIVGLYKQILEKSKEFQKYEEIENKIKNNISKIGDIIKIKKDDPLYKYFIESKITEKGNTIRTERDVLDVLDVLDGLLESFGNISLTVEPKTEKSKTSPKSSNLTNKVKQARLEDIRGKITELRRNNTELKRDIAELRRKLNLINKELTYLIREKEALEEEIDDSILYNKKQRNQIEEGDGMSTGGSKNKSKSKPKSKLKSKKNKEKSLIEKVKTLFKF